MSLNDHAKYRAHERYGVQINRKKYHELCLKIRQGKGNVLKKSTNTRSVIEIENMVVIYSKSTKKIITFLPFDCREKRMK